MKTLLKSLAILTALLLVISLAACGGSTAPAADAPAADTASIVGSWEYEGGGFIYTFNEDGTGTYDLGGGSVMNFTYEATDSELSILYDGNTEPMVLEYVLSGTVLNVKDSFGSDTIYNKK